LGQTSRGGDLNTPLLRGRQAFARGRSVGPEKGKKRSGDRETSGIARGEGGTSRAWVRLRIPEKRPALQPEKKKSDPFAGERALLSWGRKKEGRSAGAQEGGLNMDSAIEKNLNRFQRLVQKKRGGNLAHPRRVLSGQKRGGEGEYSTGKQDGW